MSSGTQKYITSRFLPKNTVEKSYTAYTRPSTIRTHETSRKNRELLNVIAAQHEQERVSRPVSRCSSVTPDDVGTISQSDQSTTESNLVEEVQEMESVSVVTRSTSPIQSGQPSISRTRRVEVAKLVEKVITRPKKRNLMVDKEMQSDRLDDTSKYSRYGSNSTRTTSAPWTPFLDMKCSSPSDKQKVSKSESEEKVSVQSGKVEDLSETKRKHSIESKSKEGSASPKNISRANSIKNLTRSLSKLDMKSRDSKSKTPPSPSVSDKDKPKSKVTSPKTSQGSEKKLPPQIPKNNDSVNKSGSLHSLNTLNKDFRKSVLNMNHEGKLKKQHSKRSSSISSAESGSEAQLSEATDVSENLTTCSSFHKSSTFSSKLPQRIQAEANSRRSATRSPSSDTSSSSSNAASGSEDDTRTKAKPIENKLKKQHSTGSSRTSLILSPLDDSPTEKSPKPPLSPRVKTEGQRTEAEAKSFLMRALAPVTNLFKVKHVDSSDRINWMDSNSSETGRMEEANGKHPEQKKCVRRIESGERAWWLEEKSESPKISPEEKIINKTIRTRVDSGEKPWWLDDSAEAPEGVQAYPDEEEDSRMLYKVRKNDSGAREWWLDSNEENSKNNSSAPPLEAEYLQTHQLRHIDSGERAWWLNSTENIADASKSETSDRPKYQIRPQNSGEKPWWFDNQANSTQKLSDDESDSELVPLGDRASPEGLETPRDEELQGRTTPYDNVPESHCRNRKPSNINLFISKHTDIDDILGGSTQLLSPLMDRIFNYQRGYEECEEIDPGQVKIHDSTAQRGVIEPGRL